MTGQAVTLPLEIEHNRPLIRLEVLRPDGATRQPIRCVVDTGGGSFIVSEPVARDLHLPFGQVFESEEEGGRFALTRLPPVWAGSLQLDLQGLQALILLDRSTIMPGQAVDALIPGRLLARYHLILDYPEGRLTLAEHGTVKPRGTPVPSPVHPESGFPRLEVVVDSEPLGMLLDTGASCTMISEGLFRRWKAAHPEWPVADGAFGPANMGGGPLDGASRMIRLPVLTVGPFRLEGLAAVSRSAGAFEQRVSRLMTAPVVGLVGGNALRHFRVEIDYAGGVTYLEQHGAPDPIDTDMVGLVLQPHRNGTFTVSATTKDLAELVHPGDRLLQVDGKAITGLSLPAAVDALRGTPGEGRTLLLERGGVRRVVQAKVRRIV